jgi:hypothetical protein
MNSHAGKHPITLKRMVYRIDGMEAVRIRRDMQYLSSTAGPLTLDVYLPQSSPQDPPVVVLVTGYPDVGVARPLGCAFKDMEVWISLGQLLAASGIAAIGYTTHDPIADVDALLDYVSTNAGTLGVDAGRIGLWATSGHVPAALATLARRRQGAIKAAVLSTGFTLDLEGSRVADAARTYGFVNASAGLSVEDLPGDLPLFIARAGRDENPGLNEALDRFAAAAIRRNLPVTLVNHATAGHAFEIDDTSVASQHIVSQMLRFMQVWLSA